MVRALALALVALALLPASALAHATLEATIPERGAKLDKPPAQVTFRFDESVEASFGALRVFDSKGQEVQTGKAFHPNGTGSLIAVKLKPGIGDGTYTATYRVVSADGHVVSSGFVFNVGEASAPAETLDQLLASGGKAGPITNTALGFARAFQYAAIALGVGALIFFLVCWRGLGVASRPFVAKLERILLVASIVGCRLGRRRAGAAGRRRRGRVVLVRRPPGHDQRGARHALRSCLGHRRGALDHRRPRARDAAAAPTRYAPRGAGGAGRRTAPDRRRLARQRRHHQRLGPGHGRRPDRLRRERGQRPTDHGESRDRVCSARLDPPPRRARGAALRARPAAVVRRSRERAVAGRDPAAREHHPRARR